MTSLMLPVFCSLCKVQTARLLPLRFGRYCPDCLCKLFDLSRPLWDGD